MKKILLGLIAVIVVAAAGYFGFDAYVQHRVTRDVEAAFEQIRASGAKASHGKVAFDTKSRTLTIADIATESASATPFSIKVASLTASGVGQPDTARFSAANIELADVEVSASAPTQTIESIAYKSPRITVKDYAGPAGTRPLPASSSLLDLYRFALEQMASISAASVTIPTITGTIKTRPPGGGDAGGEFTYSGLAVENIKDGKIASTRTESTVFTFNSQAGGKAIKMTGNLANVVASDIDFGVLAAIFDPGKAGDDRLHRVYRQVSAGPYIISATPGVNLRIEGITADDVGLRPSRIQLPKLMAMIPPAGAAPPTQAQAREMLDTVASLYEGIRIGNTEMRGLSIETPQGPFKLAAMRFNFDNGKIGEVAVEGMDTRAATGPVKVGRFALKSVDIANLMRLSAQFAGQRPSPEQALALFPLIEGAELKGLVAPYKATGKPVMIDVLSLDWGQFIGTIPSKLHLVAKMAGPLDATDPKLQPLVAAGIDRMAVDADLAAAWTESSREFTLEPVKLELSGLLNASARLSLGNVPREAFSASAIQATTAAAQIEAGAIELTLHDLGVIDLAIAQHARKLGVGKDEARQAILDGIKAQSDAVADNPGGSALLAAISRFVETPGQTLVIKLTPLAKAPALQLIQLLKTDPQLALAQFKIEASTGL